jgi:hypothetical protein
MLLLNADLPSGKDDRLTLRTQHGARGAIGLHEIIHDLLFRGAPGMKQFAHHFVGKIKARDVARFIRKDFDSGAQKNFPLLFSAGYKDHDIPARIPKLFLKVYRGILNRHFKI